MKIGLVILGILCLAEVMAIAALAKSNKNYKSTNRNLIRQMRELRGNCEKVTLECENAKSECIAVMNYLDNLTEKWLTLKGGSNNGWTAEKVD